MAYSSSLTDAEWEILEPLLPEVLPQKKKTKPLSWSYRELIDGMLYRLMTLLQGRVREQVKKN